MMQQSKRQRFLHRWYSHWNNESTQSFSNSSIQNAAQSAEILAEELKTFQHADYVDRLEDEKSWTIQSSVCF